MDKETLQIPLAVPTFPRSASLDKDAYLKNCYIDKSKTDKSYAVKRPGFLVGSEGVTTGLYRGIYSPPWGTTAYLDTYGQLQWLGGLSTTSGLGSWSPVVQYLGGGPPVANGVGKSYPTDFGGLPPPKGIPPPVYPAGNDYWSGAPQDSLVMSARVTGKTINGGGCSITGSGDGGGGIAFSVIKNGAFSPPGMPLPYWNILIQASCPHGTACGNPPYPSSQTMINSFYANFPAGLYVIETIYGNGTAAFQCSLYLDGPDEGLPLGGSAVYFHWGPVISTIDDPTHLDVQFGTLS